MRHFVIADGPAPSRTRPRANTSPRLSLELTDQADSEHESLLEFAKERKRPATLSEVASSKHAMLALFQMNGGEVMPSQVADASELRLLRSIPMAYQLDILVQKFKAGGFEGPTVEVILGIMSEMEDEAIFGPGIDRLD